MAYINKKYPLIIESHPENYTGYPFITLLVYGEEKILTIIDNHDKHNINAFVLDYCRIEKLNEDLIIKVAADWYYSDKSYPVSIEFAKAVGLETHKIFKSFNINYVKRIIGPLPEFNMDITKKIKRKKRKISDTNIKINYNPLDIWSSNPGSSSPPSPVSSS